VKICYRLDLDSLPKAFEIHDLDGLLVLTGLKRRLDQARHRRVKANWDKLALFKEKHVNELRYLPAAQSTREQAQDVLNWLHLAPYGVLLWLDQQALNERPAGFATYSPPTP